ncbi:MAG: efflux transporter periplasmic adaptor subunit [Chitinophagaceae bacterium]|nr:efflux transporter periplasmic adaptor subunit [Chitinophagaceae bacterium]
MVAAGSFIWISCSSHASTNPQQPAVIPVTSVSVKLKKTGYYDEYPGTMTALNQVNITPEVSGYITGIHFRDGQRVTKGQLLYTLDQQQYQANVLQASANYRVALANQQMAQQDADRYLFLQKNDAIATQLVDHSLTGLQTAKMQLAAAKAAIQNVQTSLKYSTIYAPFTGTIGISLVKPGTAVSPGATLLNTISSDNPVAVDFNVDEKEISRFEQLQQQPISKTDSTFMIRLPNGKLYPFNGHVTLLDRAVDPQTGTIKTRIVFDNPSNELKAGMSCTVRVQNNSKDPQLLIPYKAVTEQLGEYFVFLVNNNTVRQQKIIPGRVLGDEVIVSQGLHVGDIVVTEGTGKLNNGSAVSSTSKE